MEECPRDNTLSMASITDSSESLSAGAGAAVSVAVVPAPPPLTLWRWSVNKYHEMVRSGIIDEDAPVELLEGWVVQKMTKSPLHRTVTGLLRDVLQQVIPAGWFVNSQDPVTLAASEPEPDAVLVRGSRLDYLDHHPGPGDVALVAEVSDSALSRGRVFKKSIYAAAGIAVYWVVNLVDRPARGLFRLHPFRVRGRLRAVRLLCGRGQGSPGRRGTDRGGNSGRRNPALIATFSSLSLALPLFRDRHFLFSG